MLPLKSILFLILYLAGLFGSVVYHPLLGVLGYIVTYNIDPAHQWWGFPLVKMGLRYSLFMAVAIGVGMFLNKERLNFNRGLHSQEKFYFILVLIMWVSIVLGLAAGYNSENFALKMTKVALFLWMLTRIITSLRDYEIILWTLIIVGFYLGIEALGVSTSYYGRIDSGVGGSDFSEGNFLGAHFAMLLPFIGIFFLKSGWKSKAICLLAGVFVTNGMVLCRSRGVFVALIVGMVFAIIKAPSGLRGKIVIGVTIAAIGAFFLMDPGFLSRMQRINPNVFSVEKQDDSATGRILAWKAALSMTSDYPLGVGQGNFKKYVGQYNPDIPGKDTHNTFFRCLTELGVQGLAIYLIMIANAFRILKRVKNKAIGLSNEIDYKWHTYALAVSLVIFLSSGMFITHTYIEELYWLLMFPVLLERAVENEQETVESIG